MFSKRKNISLVALLFRGYRNKRLEKAVSTVICVILARHAPAGLCVLPANGGAISFKTSANQIIRLFKLWRGRGEGKACALRG